MEEHLDKIVYLIDHLDKIVLIIAGIVWVSRYVDWVFRGDAEERPAQEVPAWGATQEKPATTPYPQATPPALSPVYPQPHSTPKAAAQQQSQPTKDRVLSRYSGWKRAIVMQEIMRPPT